MRLNLATKFSATIVSVVALAIVSSTVALLCTWHTRRLLQDTVRNDLPSIRIAGELQMALCEPRGFLASYMLDASNRKWLEDLQKEKQAFNDRLAEARATVHTSEAKEGLDRLEKAYREYERRRDQVVLLFDHGDVEGARHALLVDVNNLYQKAFEQVEAFVASTQRNADTQVASVERQVAGVTGLVTIGVALAVGLGIGLVLLFFYGVLLPLRRMMADARQFSGEKTTPVGQPREEIRAVGEYLRALMSNMADTRSNLERSRHQLLQSEKLASVGKLAASVAHEIRNPLTSMKMWLFSIRKTVGHDPELDHSFDIVSEEMARLESIVRNFLEFSRPPVLKPRPQCLGEVIDKTLELACHQIEEKQIALQREVATDLPPVMADREQLKQVLINLLNNAVEATPDSGRICVRASLEKDRQNEPMVVVRVQDSGSGIPEEVQRRVFEPFFTTKEHGNGLGLCIAAQIVGQHGGRLALESSTEQGTSFAVWIPTARTENHEQDSCC